MKLTKGCYGYLKSRRKREIGKTILYFALSAAIFLMGYLSTGTKVNLLTVVAVLGCLPASRSTVSAIMYIRAGTCSDACYREVCAHAGETLMLYDLYLTSYQKNFQISAMAVKNNAVCGYTEDANCDLAAGEKHISDMLAQNGCGEMTVKLFSDLPKFTDRLIQMGDTRKKKAERDSAAAEIIKDISL